MKLFCVSLERSHDPLYTPVVTFTDKMTQTPLSGGSNYESGSLTSDVTRSLTLTSEA